MNYFVSFLSLVLSLNDCGVLKNNETLVLFIKYCRGRRQILVVHNNVIDYDMEYYVLDSKADFICYTFINVFKEKKSTFIINHYIIYQEKEGVKRYDSR